MRRIGLGWKMFVCACALLCSAAALAGSQPAPLRVLFVGNSLTYVGNLPAVFEALAAANGRAVTSEMLVHGGAALASRGRSEVVQQLLASQKFDYVVLQERGGDVNCYGMKSTAPADCPSSRAHRELGAMVRAAGAKPVLLGTYQPAHYVFSKLIEANEEDLAAATGAIHIPVSETVRLGHIAQPALQWFASDGMHLGRDLTLWEAGQLYAALFGAPAAAHALDINRPIFEAHAHFDGGRLAGTQGDVALATPSYHYDAARVAQVLAIGAAGRH